jgi:hypothetical protein
MTDPVDQLRGALDALAAVDLGALDRDQLRSGTLALHRAAEQIRVLEAAWLAESDRAAVWLESGSRNTADWLATHTGTNRGHAIELLKLADTIEASPAIATAPGDGTLSTHTAVALHDVVRTPPAGADIDTFVDQVLGHSPHQARQAIDQLRELHRTGDDAAAELERIRQRRSLTSRHAGDGTVITTLVLPVLESRQFHQAVQHAAGERFDTDDRTREQRLADGAVLLAQRFATASLGGGRERATILVTIPADALTGASEAPGITDHGDVVPAEAVRRLADHAIIHRLTSTGTRILDLGRSARLASDDQYKALVTRDGGCRWPGCTIPARWCEVDHLIPWERGGPTDLDNLVLWCSHHHHTKHRPDVAITGTSHDLTIDLPDGTRLRSRPPDRAPTATTAA